MQNTIIPNFNSNARLENSFQGLKANRSSNFSTNELRNKVNLP